MTRDGDHRCFLSHRDPVWNRSWQCSGPPISWKTLQISMGQLTQVGGVWSLTVSGCYSIHGTHTKWPCRVVLQGPPMGVPVRSISRTPPDIVSQDDRYRARRAPLFGRGHREARQPLRTRRSGDRTLRHRNARIRTRSEGRDVEASERERRRRVERRTSRSAGGEV
jgi:hypothetical protein